MNKNRSSTIKKLPPVILTKEEMIELSKKMAEGDTRAREKLIVSHLWIVEKLASAKAASMPSNVDKEELYQDLYQEGCFGLIEAIDRYDWRRNLYISTYAYSYVRKYMFKYLRESVPMIRLPEHIYYNCYKYRKFMDSYYSENLKKPTKEECIKKLGLNEDIFNSILKYNYLLSNTYGTDATYVRFEEDVSDELFFVGPETVTENISGPDFSEYGVILTNTEEEVLTLRFGYKNNCPLSFKEIGEKLGFSDELARTTYHKAIEKIKEKLTN